jgi:hypothetical protein
MRLDTQGRIWRGNLQKGLYLHPSSDPEGSSIDFHHHHHHHHLRHHHEPSIYIVVIIPNPSVDLHMYFFGSLILHSYNHGDVVFLNVRVVSVVLGEWRNPSTTMNWTWLWCLALCKCVVTFFNDVVRMPTTQYLLLADFGGNYRCVWLVVRGCKWHDMLPTPPCIDKGEIEDSQSGYP